MPLACLHPRGILAFEGWHLPIPGNPCDSYVRRELSSLTSTFANFSTDLGGLGVSIASSSLNVQTRRSDFEPAISLKLQAATSTVDVESIDHHLGGGLNVQTDFLSSALSSVRDSCLNVQTDCIQAHSAMATRGPQEATRISQPTAAPEDRATTQDVARALTTGSKRHREATLAVQGGGLNVQTKHAPAHRATPERIQLQTGGGASRRLNDLMVMGESREVSSVAPNIPLNPPIAASSSWTTGPAHLVVVASRASDTAGRSVPDAPAGSQRESTRKSKHFDSLNGTNPSASICESQRGRLKVQTASASVPSDRLLHTGSRLLSDGSDLNPRITELNRQIHEEPSLQPCCLNVQTERACNPRRTHYKMAGLNVQTSAAVTATTMAGGNDSGHMVSLLRAESLCVRSLNDRLARNELGSRYGSNRTPPHLAAPPPHSNRLDLLDPAQVAGFSAFGDANLEVSQ